jgi:uncharacterized damage-inducible protein DinB
MDPNIIDRYEHGGEKLKQAIKGLTRDDMHSFPVPGTWSIQQIVLHLADSDLVMSDRMKRVIAEDNPSLLAFDETLWVKNLHYELQSAEDAANLFDLNRRLLATILRVLPDAAFARKGNHSERGPLTLAQLVESAVNHLEHHLKFIYDKREKLGKLMW